MKKIKTALLSFGMSGKVFHAPFLHVHQGFELLGSWERSKQQIQSIYPNAKSYASLKELLEDDCELVIINTPNITHFNYAKEALQAGKHVIVEKPFTITVAEGEELQNLAYKYNKLIIPYQNRRYNSDYKTVQRIIHENWLGNIVETEIRYDRYTPTISPKKHKETGQKGTGILYDLGAHLIDQALQLFGWPNSVFADIAITRQHSLIDDYFELILFYNNLRVRLKSGYFIREQLPGYILYGTKGTFFKTRADVQEAHLIAGKMPDSPDWGVESISDEGLLHTEKDGKIIREKVNTERGNYMDFFEAAYQSIINNAPVPVTVNEGIAIIKIIEAAFKSNEEKKVIDLV